MVTRSHLTWRGDWLYFGGRKIIRIVPDETYPEMWRVEVEGRKTDMVNRTRAKDVATGFALGIVDPYRGGNKRAAAEPGGA
jgi:hypothetical protein